MRRMAWAWLALVLLAGCAPAETAPECVVGAGDVPPTGAAPPDPPLDPALPAPPAAPFAVTLEAADKAQVWTVEAAHGLLDERFVLTAGPAPASTARQSIPVSVSVARLAADPPVALRLEGARGGLVDLAPGASVVLRLTGGGFTREGVYRAALTVGGSETRVYALRIRSATPFPPLGLRTTELYRTWEDVPPLRRRGRATAVIAVDAAAADTRPYHVVVRPPASPSPGAQHLPSCGVVVHGTGRTDAVAIELPPLEAGLYEGVIDLQGEPLQVRVTLKNPAWIVALVVFLGGLGSLLVRAFARYFSLSAESESAIAREEKKIGTPPCAWDLLRVRNVLREARGSISWLTLDDVVDLLKDAVPRERPELFVLQAALDEPALPAAFKDDLRAELARALRWSARSDADDVDRRLTQLHAVVQGGAPAWVADLRRHVEDEQKRIAPDLEVLAARDARGAARVHAALTMCAALIADAARVVARDPEWFRRTPEHAAQLRRVRRTLLLLPDWVTRPRAPDDEITAVLHCRTEDVRGVPEDDPLPGLCVRRRQDVFAVDLRAHQEVTFEIARACPPAPGGKPLRRSPDAQVWACDKWPITWRVNGAVVASPAGPRLTYVFPAWSWIWGKTRPMTVTATIGDGLAEPGWEGLVSAAHSPKLSRRGRAEVVNTLVTVLGVGVASVAAVALYWTGKPFGSWSDYMTLLTTGLGVDVGLGTGSKLVGSVVDFLRRKAVPAP